MRRDPYIVNVDRRRNCYSCRSFGYLEQNCRSWKIIGQRRRMEYDVVATTRHEVQ